MFLDILFLLVVIGINLTTYLYRFPLYQGITELVNDVDHMTDLNIYTNLLIFSFGKILFFHLVHNLSYRYLSRQVYHFTSSFCNNLVRKIYRHDISFYEKTSSQELAQLWYYNNSLKELLRKIILDVPTIVIYLGYYTYKIYCFSPNFAYIVIGCNILLVLLTHPLTRKQYQLEKNRTTIDLNMKNTFMDTAKNMLHVKLSNTEEHEDKRYFTLSDSLLQNKLTDLNYGVLRDIVSEFLIDIIRLLIYIQGAYFIMNGEIKNLMLLYLASHAANFYGRLLSLKGVYNSYCRMKPRLDVVKKYYYYKVVEDVIPTSSYEIIGNIRFDNITFAYPSSKPLFEDFSFTLKENVINILKGANGSGKSTLVKLLLRLYDIQKGTIYIGESNILEMRVWPLRSNFTFVTQSPQLFNENLEYNLTYGDTKEEHLDTLLEMLGCTNFKDRLNEHVVGNNFSGGEQKKIQLVNAGLRKARYIIFDEPTNALDTKTINQFGQYLNQLVTEGHTIIIITHDKRMLDLGDHIINLN